jgi:hypothetical protein
MKSYLMFVVWALLAAGAAIATEPVKDPFPWPQFRGPGGQGHVDVAIPITWGEKKHVAWKTPLPGKGSSSPVIADGKAWVTTVVPIAGGGLSLRIIGIDLLSGKIEHNVELFAITTPPRTPCEKHAGISDPRRRRRACHRLVRKGWRGMRGCRHRQGTVAQRNAES